MLLPQASSIAAADERLAPLVTRALLERIVGAVPDAWLAGGAGSMGTPAEHRQAYVDYLLGRLETPRPFVLEADRARQS